MTLPADLRRRIGERVGPVAGAEPVGGGCVGVAFRVLVDGRPFFLKTDDRRLPDLFAVEAAGLRALSSARGLRVPRVVDHEDVGPAGSWILLEWLDVVAATPASWMALGTALADLHRHTGPTWGWERDGYIGVLVQSNATEATWPAFWIERRIRPQLERAFDGGFLVASDEWDRLFDALPDLLAPADADPPSLLHGDLWSGNVLATREGPALIDPAVYRGHREVDLAMADLFGGFPPDFFAAYDAAWPLLPGYEVRRPVYHLYYLLVHVNLFGSSYVGRTIATLRSVLRPR